MNKQAKGTLIMKHGIQTRLGAVLLAAVLLAGAPSLAVADDQPAAQNEGHHHEAERLPQSHYQARDREGKHQRFHDNGVLAEEGQYEADQRVGEWRSYNEDGDKVAFRLYDQGRLVVERRYDDSGELTRKVEPWDTPHGPGSRIRRFSEQELVEEVIETYTGNWASIRLFDDEGAVKTRGERLDGQRVGTWQKPKEGGVLTRRYDDQGHRHGQWVLESKSGERLQWGAYDRGVSVGEWRYRDGWAQELGEGRFDDAGNRVGEWGVLNEHGYVRRKESYREGRIEGRRYHFRDDGSLERYADYSGGEQVGPYTHFEPGDRDGRKGYW
ncbi:MULTISPECIES: toxin-antitoxin system YwqK family antitoxin [unclassified Thioalkalivibrio]|uniref:toxin-antitoxin system YwqK family antitoxin n=1 Tax=unclassified Thioalkalivibrio TaxID=2621013 RepID=UPI00037D8150|nr:MULTISPECIES: hypothetical protein [unclassified Thioalkalivibrio]